MLREAENSYSFNYDNVNQMDKLKQDILHKFELQQLTEAELLELDGQTYAAALKIYDVNHEEVCAYIFSKTYLDALKLYEEEQA